MKGFVDEVDAAVAAAGAPTDGAGCLVAVSGGRDSMLLLEVLAALRPRHHWRLAVGHLNHRLRGKAADLDARFVKAEAGRLGLRFVGAATDVARRRRRGESIELAARRMRHAFLAATARRLGFDWIATGHHGDDQSELFLLRLLRGSGASGLAGMRAVDPSPADPGLRLVRPLLGFQGDRLAAAAQELKVRFREDASNGDPAFLRNRVRHVLLPLLRERFQPAIARLLEREQILLRDQVEYLAERARAWMAGVDAGPPAFESLAPALQREVVRLQLVGLGIGPSFELIEGLRREPGVPIQVAANRCVTLDPAGRLHSGKPAEGPPPFRADEQQVALVGDGGRFQFGGLRVDWRMEPGGQRPVAAATGRECFDADALGPLIRLRHWRSGDRFQPIGLGNSAKLQDLFVNAKVPAAERRARVLVESSDGTLAWVEGLRIGERARVTDATVRRLVWRWKRVRVGAGNGRGRNRG